MVGLVRKDNEFGFGYVKHDLPLEHSGNVQKVIGNVVLEFGREVESRARDEI